MARSKHSVALFEVIHRDKRFKGNAPPKSATSTPAWWFKRRSMEAAPAVVRAVVQSEGELIDHEPPTENAAVVKRSAPPARIWQKPAMERVTQRGRELWQIVLTKVQEQSHRINGPVAGVGVALVVCVGVLLARSLRPAARPIDMAFGSTEVLRHGDAHPEVLKLYGNSGAQASGELIRTVSSGAQPASNVSAPAPRRQVELNYVLVQSYTDEKSAGDARDFLNSNGVSCTIERGIKNWRKDFYLVVGLDGFTRASGPDYTAYRKRIDSLGAQYTVISRSHRAFLPQAIKWDKP